MFYALLADLVATIHTGYAAFVVFGLLVVYIGWFAGWKWVHNRWFRGLHLAMLVTVLIRTLFAEICFLTTWEARLREIALERGAVGTAFGKLMHDLIHPEHSVSADIPLWIFPPIYAAFAVLVVGTLWLVPVHWRGRPPVEDNKAEPAAA
jgi:Protein of Unknown function (DUF2784)